VFDKSGFKMDLCWYYYFQELDPTPFVDSSSEDILEIEFSNFDDSSIIYSW